MTENEPIMERQKGFAIVEHRVSPVSNADQSLQVSTPFYLILKDLVDHFLFRTDRTLSINSCRN